jgi:hypothetical protein
MKPQFQGSQQGFGQYGRAAGVLATFAAIVVSGLLISSSPGRADNGKGNGIGNGNGVAEGSQIQIGFSIAPVPLNMIGKNPDLVGLGSYIVNAVGDCNGCHSAGPATEYIGNPALFAPPSLTVHQVKKTNPATYLGGGRDFGPFPAPNSPLHIFSRNLTPDITGKPEGGHSLAEFMQIMRTGKDFDTSVHPTCPANTAQTASCVPYPFDGGLLQIMRWPAFQDMTNRQLQAIYEYLSAIPCIDTVVSGQPQLRNTCPN